ncbi:MAG TPA: DcaP family trimeric outer membrane transporter [Burkholderiales bacterium]
MRLAASLLALLAAGAAHADDAMERGAPADRSLEERLKEKARTVPGSDVQYLFAGYVQLDALFTKKKLTGDEEDTFLASAIPFGDAGSDARLGVRASQFNALLYKPTAWGGVRALVQADLFAYEEGAKLNFTQAAVRFGEFLTVGKTYSTFMDDEGWPGTIDYNGPSGAVFARQVVVRGSVPFGDKLRAEVAFEDPAAEASAGGPNFSVSSAAERPDFVARLRFAGERLHAQVAGLSRSVTYTAQAGTSASRKVSGEGVSLSGALQIGEEDRLLAQWNQGKGISRYFNDGVSSIGAVFDDGVRLEPLELTGWYLYYERQWAARWKTVAGFSELRTDSEGLRPAEDLTRLRYASASLLHKLKPDFFVGAELLYGKAKRQDGVEASDSRLQITARYLIY